VNFCECECEGWEGTKGWGPQGSPGMGWCSTLSWYYVVVGIPNRLYMHHMHGAGQNTAHALQYQRSLCTQKHTNIPPGEPRATAPKTPDVGQHQPHNQVPMVWGSQEVAPRRLFTAVAPSLLLWATTGVPRSTSAATARAPSPAPPNDQYMYHCWLISPSPSQVSPGSQSQATRGSIKHQSAIPSFTPSYLVEQLPQLRGGLHEICG
jgi:hypothetical protein